MLNNREKKLYKYKLKFNLKIAICDKLPKLKGIQSQMQKKSFYFIIIVIL